eukprot:6199318-Pleurochrysis_carterae.AAC.4
MHSPKRWRRCRTCVQCAYFSFEAAPASQHALPFEKQDSRRRRETGQSLSPDRALPFERGPRNEQRQQRRPRRARWRRARQRPRATRAAQAPHACQRLAGATPPGAAAPSMSMHASPFSEPRDVVQTRTRCSTSAAPSPTARARRPLAPPGLARAAAAYVPAGRTKQATQTMR